MDDMAAVAAAEAAHDAARTDDDSARSDHTDNDSETSKKRSSPSHAHGHGTAQSSDHHTPRAKMRKSTYAARRDEKNELLAELAVLEERLKALNETAGVGGASKMDTERSNALMRASICDHQLSLATAQSVVSGLLNPEHGNPLSTCIRLGTNWDDRRKTLVAIKDEKIRHACAYVEARARFIDPLKPHITDERFENAAGDFCCTRFEQLQFPNVSSVRQVYDALVTYLQNIEISVSEQLGHITVRDDFVTVEDSIGNYHFLSSDCGVPVETHGVLFMQYFESHALADGGPCGVVVVDSVDDDLLYPYAPRERVRKDVVSIKVLTPQYRPRHRANASGASDCGDDGDRELVVTMAQGKFLKLHHSQCPLATPDVVARMRANITGWGDVIVRSLYDTLYHQQQTQTQQ